MAYKKKAQNQIVTTKREAPPEYGEFKRILEGEAAAMATDYIRGYIGFLSSNPSAPGQKAIYMQKDRILNTQTFQELAWYEMYQEVERDPHIMAIMGSAKLNVAGMKWDVSPYVEVKPGQTSKKKPQATARDQAIAFFVKDALHKTGYFPQHMYNLMDALGKGFAVSEIIWAIDDQGVLIKDIINRPQRRFQFDALDRSLKLRNLDAPFFGIDLPDKKFIVHRVSSQWENPFGDALDQSLYWMWLFKKTVLKFWMQHLQVGASSIPIVTHPASANAQLKAEALAIAEMIRNGAYGRIPDNFKVEYAEAKNAIQNAEAYERFIRTCNDEISKCINGQTLTAEASSNVGTGSRALGQVHQVTQTARDIFRAEGLASTLNQTLIKWLVDFNFSNVEGYPRFRFDLEDSEDLVKESTLVKNLSDAGYDFDVDELGDKFNYSLTKKEVPKALEPNPFEKKPTDPTKVDQPIEEPVTEGA